MLPAPNNSPLCSKGQSKQTLPSGVGCDLVPNSACLYILSRLLHTRETATVVTDALHSSSLMLLDMDALPRLIRIAPVDIDSLYEGDQNALDTSLIFGIRLWA